MSKQFEIPPVPDGFSILVASYNDGKIISNLLESILNQIKPTCHFELIVADNKSADNTKEECMRYADEFKKKNIGYKYLYIDQQGKSNAINIASKEAAYNHLIFTDADAKVEENYLVNLEKMAHSVRAVAYCGPYKPWYHPGSKAPKWYKEKYNENILMDHDGYLPNNQLCSGINMVFCKCIFEQLGGMPKHINYMGRNRGRGEDTELGMRLRKIYSKKSFYYSNELIVYHYTRPEYFSMLYTTKWVWSNSKMLAEMYPATSFIVKIKTILVACFVILKDLFRFLSGRDREQFPYIQNLYYEKMLPAVNSIFLCVHQLIK